jgi:hypothetical protein
MSTSAKSREPAVIYRPPSAWPTDNRTRQFTPLPQRHHSPQTDGDILERSVDLLLQKQDGKGSFYTYDEYCTGDRVDDQLAGAAMIAFYWSRAGSSDVPSDAVERAVRFHLENLVFKSSLSPFRYSPSCIDRDSVDWCNNLWCLWGAVLVLRHGATYLQESTASELREIAADYWSIVSTYSARDENPCHNQLIAYCHIGHLYSQVAGLKTIAAEVSAYYHDRLRSLRVEDRGHWIYSEFNQWDPHYSLVSWMALESLALETGDPAYREDADAMALYFNERVSAGGYVWGGSRHNEGGLDEFVHLPSNRSTELELDRLLMPEPSHLWRELAMPPHEGRTLITRMEATPGSSQSKRLLKPTPWHFRRGAASVCLQDDLKLVHLSSDGLEIIPAANALGVGTGLVWLGGGAWKMDVLQFQPPKASRAHRYTTSKAFQLGECIGLVTVQRGYIWETRQWWIGMGSSLLWIGQVVTHAMPTCDKIEFVLGTPVLTRISNRAVPVTEVESAEGEKAGTQGKAVKLSSGKFLKFGDVFIGATERLDFVRPGEDAFHTFPMRQGVFRDCHCSNEVRVQMSEAPVTLGCRESLFFGVEIGRQAPSLNSHRDPLRWRLEARAGIFEARQSGDLWHYTLETASGREDLPQTGFGFEAP